MATYNNIPTYFMGIDNVAEDAFSGMTTVSGNKSFSGNVTISGVLTATNSSNSLTANNVKNNIGFNFYNGNSLVQGYSYNGSSATSINIVSGNHITISKENNNIVISGDSSGGSGDGISSSDLSTDLQVLNGKLTHKTVAASTTYSPITGNYIYVPSVSYDTNGHVRSVVGNKLENIRVSGITWGTNGTGTFTFTDAGSSSVTTTLPTASSDSYGILTTGTQTIAGAKTFAGGITTSYYSAASGNDGYKTYISGGNVYNDYIVSSVENKSIVFSFKTSASDTSHSSLEVLEGNSKLTISRKLGSTIQDGKTLEVKGISDYSLLSKKIVYAVETACSTTSNVTTITAKEVDANGNVLDSNYLISGTVPDKGTIIALKLTQTSGRTGTSISLVLNNCSAKSINYMGTAIAASKFKTNSIVLLVYGDYDTNSNSSWNCIYACGEDHYPSAVTVSSTGVITLGNSSERTSDDVFSGGITGTIPIASASSYGLVSTGTQTISGDKTFSGKIYATGGVDGDVTGNATTATTATYLASGVGGSIRPVYVNSSGTVTACGAFSSGNYTNFIPYFNSSSIMEAGKIIDFHTETSTANYDVRLTASSSLLTCSGSITATYFTASSDIRLKDNLVPIKNISLSTLRPYQYNFKNSNEKNIGLIAQDVKEVYPEAVRENETGYLSIDYNAIVSLLVGKINELEERIKNLENK